MPAGLLLELGKEPMGKDDKSKPMGDEPSSDFDAALDDAFEAAKGTDPAAFRSAMSAAISAKVAELLSDEEG